MLLSNLNLLATAPGGVARLRELILTLAVQGKLVPQDPADEPASRLLRKIRAEKDRLIAEGKIKKDKPLAAITDEEKPFELPIGWEWQSLAEIGTWAIGSGFPHEAQGREGLPILFAKVSDMNLPGNELEIVRTNHTIDDKTVERLRINVHQSGTVIFPKIGGAIATNKRRILVRPTAIDNNCLGITPSAAMSTSYLFLLLSSIDFTVYQAGTSVPALSQGTLGQIPVGLPPIAEQSRIVAHVEELMRLCDALEAKGQLEATQHAQLLSTLLGTLTASATPEELADNWQRVAQHFDLLLDRPQAIDALEQTLLQLAVRGLLVPQDPADEPASVLLQKIRAEKDRLIAAGQIKRDKPLPPVTDEEKPFALPDSWKWVALGEVIDIVRGITFPANQKTKEAAPGRIACLRTANVQQSIEWDDLLFVDRSFMGREEQLIQHRDIVMSMANSRELVGKVALIEDIPHAEATFGGFLGVLRPRKIDPRFAMAVLRTPYARSLLIDSSSQTTNIANVSLAKLRPLPFPLPPEAEQSRIVTRVTQLRRLCFELRQRLAEREAVQARLAEALVQQVA